MWHRRKRAIFYLKKKKGIPILGGDFVAVGRKTRNVIVSYNYVGGKLIFCLSNTTNV
jgi:hypothetical protein